MDTRTIKKLIELVKETGIGKLEVKSGEEEVRITCFPESATPMMTAPMAMPTYDARSTEKRPHIQMVEAEPEKKHKPHGHSIKAPMVGTVYLAPTPGSEPFVSVGQHVKVGDTLCLIEAMKMFNKIEAEKAGVVSARLVENAQAVEYDQALFILDSGE